MPSHYTFIDYDPDWPKAFEREAERLRAILGDALVEIHHVGSSSVPGLAAKPIIDMLPVARSIYMIEDATRRMERAGYKAWGAYGLPGRCYFTRDKDGWRKCNIHIYAVDDPDVDRHLAFPSYLRAHPEVADEYEALKREAYQRFPADIEGYMEVKDAWIKVQEQVALAWWRERDMA